MLHPFSHVKIDPDEKIILKTRKHWLILLRETAGTLILALLPFIAIMLIARSEILPIVFEIPAALISFVAILWVLIVWLALFVLWTDYYLDVWIVTNHRMFNVEQIDLFNRRVATWGMERVQEIDVKIENPLQVFFDYGTIEIQTAGPTASNARMEGIPRPDFVRSTILRQISAFQNLSDTSKKQEELLHTVSHEVKGHLARSEAALASIVDEDYGAVPFPVKTMADSALAETRKGVDTVMGILDASNFKSGTMHLDKKEFDVKAAVESIAKEAQSSAARKGLSFKVIADNASYTLNGDEAKLRRHVFRNLIDNAVRYTASGGIHILLSRAGSQILFSVKDSGVGIDPETMELLFTEGGKGKDSTLVNPESTGYGLFVARTIVEAHGGRIWAESGGKGTGAQFFVELPAR